jgi:hypothetical protein
LRFEAVIHGHPRDRRWPTSSSSRKLKTHSPTAKRASSRRHAEAYGGFIDYGEVVQVGALVEGAKRVPKRCTVPLLSCRYAIEL